MQLGLPSSFFDDLLFNKLDSIYWQSFKVRDLPKKEWQRGKLLLGLLDSSVEDLGENIYFAKNPVIGNKTIQIRFMLGSTPKSDVYAVQCFEEKQLPKQKTPMNSMFGKFSNLATQTL